MVGAVSAGGPENRCGVAPAMLPARMSAAWLGTPNRPETRRNRGGQVEWIEDVGRLQRMLRTAMAGASFSPEPRRDGCWSRCRTTAWHLPPGLGVTSAHNVSSPPAGRSRATRCDGWRKNASPSRENASLLRHAAQPARRATDAIRFSTNEPDLRENQTNPRPAGAPGEPEV
jgi:hypothetical protein